MKDGQKYLNRSTLIFDAKDRFVKDPVIQVRADLMRSDLSILGDIMLMTYTPETLTKFQSFLKSQGLEHMVYLEKSEEVYKLAFERNRDECLSWFASLLIYVLLVVSFMYQSIFLYFSENKELIAINYLSGKSFYQRYTLLMSTELLIYTVCFVVGYWLFKLPFTFIVIFTLLALVLQVVLLRIMVNRFERRNMVGILKGE